MPCRLTWRALPNYPEPVDGGWLTRPVALAAAMFMLGLATGGTAWGAGKLDGVGIPVHDVEKLSRARYVERLKDGGVSELRFKLAPRSVNKCEPGRPLEVPSSTSSKWSDWDERLQILANKGLKAVPLIISWEERCFGTAAESDGGTRGIPTRNREAVADFYRALVKRYSTAGRGSYWQGNAGPDLPVERYEIHNEPNLEVFWNSREDTPSLWREIDAEGRVQGDCDPSDECVPSAGGYADYLNRTARVIHDVQPDADVISAGLADDVSGRRWPSIEYPVVNGAAGSDSYLDDMLQRLEREHGGPGAAWDELGFHAYGSWRTASDGLRVLETGEQSTGDLTERVYDELARHGVETDDRRIALTEWGWGTYSTGEGGGQVHYIKGRIPGADSVSDADSAAEQNVVRAAQAHYLAATHADLAAIRSRAGITRAFVYELQDKVQFPRDGHWTDYSGLFEHHGEPKPAWAALVEAFEGQSDGGSAQLP